MYHVVNVKDVHCANCFIRFQSEEMAGEMCLKLLENNNNCKTHKNTHQNRPGFMLNGRVAIGRPVQFGNV